MLKIETRNIVELNTMNGFRGIAYDGRWFYFTEADKNKIIKFDITFHQIDCFETCRSYSYICYDSTDCCFWATSREDISCIYKLNVRFEQMDKLDILIPRVRERMATGIIYDTRLDKILISYANAILSMDKHSLNDCSILYSYYNKRIRGVTGLFSSYLCYGVTRSRHEIRIFSEQGRLRRRFFIPSYFRMEGMVSMQDARNCWENHLYLLLTKRNGSQFVMECVVVDYGIYEHEKFCSAALESIAIKGTRIAQSLKDESEKIIYIIHSSDNPGEINAAIASLCKLIDRAANEERILTDQLQKLMKNY